MELYHLPWPESRRDFELFLLEEVDRALACAAKDLLPPAQPVIASYFASKAHRPDNSREETVVNVSLFAALVSATVSEDIEKNNGSCSAAETVLSRAFRRFEALATYARNLYDEPGNRHILYDVYKRIPASASRLRGNLFGSGRYFSLLAVDCPLPTQADCSRIFARYLRDASITYLENSQESGFLPQNFYCRAIKEYAVASVAVVAACMIGYFSWFI